MGKEQLIPNFELIKSKKEIEWNNKEKEVEGWGDKLGRGIDEKIKNIVVAFDMIGLPTSSSCEGHLDHGYSAPWIGIKAPNEPAERFIDQDKIFQKIADEYNLSLDDMGHKENREIYFKAFDEFEKNGETLEFQQWRQKNQELIRRASELLNKFYKERKVLKNIKLGIIEYAEGEFRIYNGGEDYHPITEEKFEKLTEGQKNELSRRLEQYQNEMKEFAKFLKEKIF